MRINMPNLIYVTDTDTRQKCDNKLSRENVATYCHNKSKENKLRFMFLYMKCCLYYCDGSCYFVVTFLQPTEEKNVTIRQNFELTDAYGYGTLPNVKLYHQ